MAHDAVMVLAAAIRAAGPDRAAIRNYLRRLGVSRPPFQGVTGPIAFGAGLAPRLAMARLGGGTVIRAPGP